jgi:hypothetical protein
MPEKLATAAELNNTTQIPVNDYNDKISNLDSHNEASIVDNNSNGIIDSEDSFASAMSGQLTGLLSHEALEDVCKLMTPHKTHTLLTPAAQRFMNKRVNDQQRGFVIHEPNSETWHVYSKHTNTYIPLQSHGRFVYNYDNVETDQEGCQYSIGFGVLDMERSALKIVTNNNGQCTQEYLDLDLENHGDLYRMTEDPNDCPEDYVK